MWRAFVRRASICVAAGTSQAAPPPLGRYTHPFTPAEHHCRVRPGAPATHTVTPVASAPMGSVLAVPRAATTAAKKFGPSHVVFSRNQCESAQMGGGFVFPVLHLP